MGTFKGKVSLTPIPKENIWVTDETFSYVFENMGIRITIFKGFATDGASIPSFLWRIIGHPFEPRSIRAAVVHDFLYSKRCSLNIDRKKADREFNRIMKQDGVWIIRRTLMYFGVRIGGWFRFCKNHGWTIKHIIN